MIYDVIIVSYKLLSTVDSSLYEYTTNEFLKTVCLFLLQLILIVIGIFWSKFNGMFILDCMIKSHCILKNRWSIAFNKLIMSIGNQNQEFISKTESQNQVSYGFWKWTLW